MSYRHAPIVLDRQFAGKGQAASAPPLLSRWKVFFTQGGRNMKFACTAQAPITRSQGVTKAEKMCRNKKVYAEQKAIEFYDLVVHGFEASNSKRTTKLNFKDS
jgi:hypothetical protein